MYSFFCLIYFKSAVCLNIGKYDNQNILFYKIIGTPFKSYASLLFQFYPVNLDTFLAPLSRYFVIS